MSMKKINNKGFSLVELIVVVGIIAIVSGVFTFGFSLVSNKQVDQCTKKIQISLENARTTSMGKSSVSLKFEYSGGKIYVNKSVVLNGNTTTTKSDIGDGALVVKYKLSNATNAVELKNNSLTGVSFDRASGALKPLPGDAYLEYFEISNGRKTTKLKINKVTGRVTIE